MSVSHVAQAESLLSSLRTLDFRKRNLAGFCSAVVSHVLSLLHEAVTFPTKIGEAKQKIPPPSLSPRLRDTAFWNATTLSNFCLALYSIFSNFNKFVQHAQPPTRLVIWLRKRRPCILFLAFVAERR